MASGSQPPCLGEHHGKPLEGQDEPERTPWPIGQREARRPMRSGRIDDHQSATASLHAASGELCLRNLPVALGDDEGHRRSPRQAVQATMQQFLGREGSRSARRPSRRSSATPPAQCRGWRGAQRPRSGRPAPSVSHEVRLPTAPARSAAPASLPRIAGDAGAPSASATRNNVAIEPRKPLVFGPTGSSPTARTSTGAPDEPAALRATR